MVWKKTRCLEILHNLISYVNVTDLKLVHASYDASHLTAIIEDLYNKQKYEVRISPVREEGNVNEN